MLAAADNFAAHHVAAAVHTSSVALAVCNLAAALLVVDATLELQVFLVDATLVTLDALAVGLRSLCTLFLQVPENDVSLKVQESDDFCLEVLVSS